MTADELLETMRHLTDQVDRQAERLAAISLRLSELEVRLAKNGTRGRKAKPVLHREPGVCGLDPTCDSATCEAANVYRYQQGCLGTACVERNREYYAEYRERRRQRAAQP